MFNDFYEYTPDSACTSGIDELSVTSFTIYPNPAKAFAIISWDNRIEKKNLEIKIFDTKGKTVFTAALVEKKCDAEFYYYTGYGSPLVYARVVDLLGKAGVGSLAGKKLLDFGYGTVGHVRLLASMGCDAHGVDVEPVFHALYSRPGDQGEVLAVGSAPDGKITLHCGRWPAERDVVREIGTGYDIITSKNTLKRGYIHPARHTDPRFLVRLGVDDGSFLRRVHEALKPGGLFLIYNLSPAQNPESSGKPYLPQPSSARID